MARTDFEDEGGSLFIAFGENSAGTRYPVRVAADGRVEVRNQSELTRVDVELVTVVDMVV